MFRSSVLRVMLGCFPLVCLLSASQSISSAAEMRGSQPVDFNRQILPILSDNCFACHGPDASKRKGDLRLDTKEGVFADGEIDPIVTPGDSALSELYQTITDPDESQRMPPIKSNRGRLTPAQVDLVKRWIDEGAPYERHWAFVAPKRPEVPSVVQKAWARNPIDNFVLASLEAAGLKPSPEADKATLLRRVTFDLTGLPPTLAALDSFLSDHSADAYEKRVDQLLASPRYGERMAMMWLDLARYADTHGFAIDSLREMWRWRDWVINAYNQNMRYDQFTIKQLAGDLLPGGSVEDQIATGFNRNHMIDFLGGSIPEEDHVEYVVDRVNTTGTTWMGLTLGCARCHDHKFDPVTQKDFYRFFAFFNTVPERGMDGDKGNGNAVPVLLLPSAQQKHHLDELDRQIAENLTRAPEENVVKEENAWRQLALARMPKPPQEGLTAYYRFEDNLQDSSGNGNDAKMERGEVQYEPRFLGKAGIFNVETEVSFGHAGDFERGKPFTVGFWLNDRTPDGVDLLQKKDTAQNWKGYEIALDDRINTGVRQRKYRLYMRLASRWPEDAIEVRTKNQLIGNYLQHLTVAYDGSGKAAGVQFYVDGNPAEIEVVKDQLSGDIHNAAPLSIGNKSVGRPLRGEIDDLRIYNRLLTPGEIADISVGFMARNLLADLTGRPTMRIAGLEPEQPPAEADIGTADKAKSREEEQAELWANEQQWLSEYFINHEARDEYRIAYAKIKELRVEKQHVLLSLPSTMVMAEMKKPRDTFVLGRGQYDNPKEKVTAGVPAFLLPVAEDTPANRLTLAKWLVDPQNPLTARVEVNRYWQNYFGTGIVKTAEDFGVQGEAPSHPELLDWLATEFMRTGWDIKAMQKLIVTSATYRQSSRATPEMQQRDPENRLLARGPRMRLPAEEIRDGALAVSGLLRERLGGPSVYPYQPKGIWEELSDAEEYTGQSYQQSSGADLYRRSLYTIWKRSVPPPTLAIFDAPDREKSTARRGVTNTPLQALVLLNDPTYVEASRALAERVILEAGRDPIKRVNYAFRLATSRDPGTREQRVLLQLSQDALAQFQRDRSSALKLIRVGEHEGNRNVDSAELAAWTTVTSTILNLDETISKE